MWWSTRYVEFLSDNMLLIKIRQTRTCEMRFTLYSVALTVYNVTLTLCIVSLTVYSVSLTVCSVTLTVYSVTLTVYSVTLTVYSIALTVCNIIYSLYIIFCKKGSFVNIQCIICKITQCLRVFYYIH